MNAAPQTLSLDHKAQRLAKEYLHTEGELLSVLMEMKKQNIFPELNYSGIFDYCERKLKLSKAQAFYFKSVAEKSLAVPELKIAVVEGELTLSQARRIVPVINEENKNQWIEKAKTLSQIDLEREVMTINPKARIVEKLKPINKENSELKVCVDIETEKNLERLKQVLSQKLGKPATLSQVISWCTKVTLEKMDPLKKAERSLLLQKRKNVFVHPSKSISSGNRVRIPTAIKHQVIKKNNMQCSYYSPDGRQRPQRQWLDVHHRVPVAQGGLNNLENLRILCRTHHSFIHKSCF